VELRLAKPADLEALAAFDERARASDERRGLLAASIRARHCVVAERDGELLGYAISDRSFFGRPFVALVHVRDAARRQRVGTALLRELEARCDGPQLFTSTNQSNVPMQRLLASLGWEPSGVVLNLDPGDPELIYVLRRSMLGGDEEKK
jgi:GNAT superfamily N-acetyltransferase